MTTRTTPRCTRCRRRPRQPRQQWCRRCFAAYMVDWRAAKKKANDAMQKELAKYRRAALPPTGTSR